MIISIQTQKAMYDYILESKTMGEEITNRGLGDVISFMITELAKRLYLRSELYIGKIIIHKDSAYKLSKEKNYKCISNQLIYYVLTNIPKSITYATDRIKKQLELKYSEDFMKVKENGTKERKKLLNLCKLYLANRDIEFVYKSKDKKEYSMAKEYFLAEATLGKYSKEIFDGIAKVYTQKTLKNGTATTLGLRSDIIIQFEDIVIIIDVKVYNKIGVTYYNNYVYGSNENRFQLNSYLGAYKDKYGNKDKVVGIVLHIVNQSLWDQNKQMQGSKLTIEDDRLIYLWMIQDNGLNYVLEQYKEIITKVRE